MVTECILIPYPKYPYFTATSVVRTGRATANRLEVATLEIGYSDTIYLSKNCHCNRLFLYQIILIGALSKEIL